MYTVGEAESSADLDVAVYTADVTATVAVIIPDNGAIFQSSSSESSPAVVTLPRPGEEGSLGNNANVVVDTE